VRGYFQKKIRLGHSLQSFSVIYLTVKPGIKQSEIRQFSQAKTGSESSCSGVLRAAAIRRKEVTKLAYSPLSCCRITDKNASKTRRFKSHGRTEQWVNEFEYSDFSGIGAIGRLILLVQIWCENYLIMTKAECYKNVSTW